MIAGLSCSGPRSASFEQLRGAATIALRRGDFQDAQSLAEEAISRRELQADSSQGWTFRLLRTESLVLQLKLAEAQPDLKQEPPSGTAFDAARARQLYLRGRVAVFQGSLAGGLTAVMKARLQNPPPDLGLDLDVLEGQIRLRLGELEAGDEVLERAVAGARTAHDSYHEAQALNNIGMGRLVRSRFDDALPWFEQVLSHRDLEPFAVYAAALNNAGICYTQLGEFDRAATLQKRAIDLLEKRGSRDDRGQALGELGRTYLIEGDPRRALPYLLGALEVARANRQDISTALWAGNAAEAEIELGDWDAAQRFNDEAVRIRTTSGTGRIIWNSLNAARIAEGRGRTEEAVNLYLHTLSGSSDEPAVAWEANAGLARVLQTADRSQESTAYFERALQIIERTRSDLLKTEYKLSYLTSLIQFYREYVNALLDQGLVDRALEVADSSRGRVLAERQRIESPTRLKAADFRDAVRRSRAVALFCWLQPEVSWLWVVEPNGIHLVKLPAAARIASLVRDYQGTIASTLSDPLASPRTAGDELYESLVEPAQQWIPRGGKVLIVADGALHGLNFETLPVPAPRRHYWIEDVEIQLVPSLGLLSPSVDGQPADRGAAASRAARSLLLVGAPRSNDPRFPELRYASSEMAKIATHFGSDQVVALDGLRASPAGYHHAAPERFSMIHFTAHAAANVESPLDSAVILSPDAGGYKLYARDIAAAERSLHADLVTVSACRGAGERAYSGEGLIGFAWAFLRAGARRVIAGLWDVDDQSTADLMDALYAGLARGETPASALRRAKLALLERGAPLSRPYYWGPFELFTVTP
jgi:CHAT domain-containing protein